MDNYIYVIFLQKLDPQKVSKLAIHCAGGKDI